MVNRWMLASIGLLLLAGLIPFAYERSLVPAARSLVIVPLDVEDGAMTRQTFAAKETFTAKETLAAKETPSTGLVFYTCAASGRAFAVEYGGEGERLALTINGGTQTLLPIASTGAREYSDGVLTFRPRGDLADIDINGQTAYEDCQVQR